MTFRCTAACAAGVLAVLARTGIASELASLTQRNVLTDDWCGRRSALAQRGIEMELVYTADVFSNLRGGLRTGTVYLDNLDLTLTAHLDLLLGLEGGTFFIYGISNQGGGLSRRYVGDVQGADDIEAPHEVKLYELWWQQMLLADRLSLLAGLYDLNSEFDVIDSAAVFINSSFGIGAAFSHSGVNGPSVFPSTAVGGRVKVAPFNHLLLQAAVLDGIPGDPRHPAATDIKFDDDDGLLIATEAAIVWPLPAAPAPLSLERERQRRIGRGWEPLPYTFKLAVGTWFYTTKLQDLTQVDADGNPVKHRGDPGVYVLADVKLYRSDASSSRGLSAFAQAGLADPHVEQFAGYTGAGLVYMGPPGRPADQTGIGVAAALNGSPYEQTASASGLAPAGAEIALEWTYRAVLTPWLALQPDFQYIIHPGGLISRPNAVVIGLRSEIDF